MNKKREYRHPVMSRVDVGQSASLLAQSGLTSNGPSATYMSNPTVNTSYYGGDDVAWY